MAKVTIENLHPVHVRAARAILNMSVSQFAAYGEGLTPDKVRGFENERPASDRTRQALIDAIEGAGVALLNGGKHGARVADPELYAMACANRDK